MNHDIRSEIQSGPKVGCSCSEVSTYTKSVLGNMFQNIVITLKQRENNDGENAI